MSNGGLFQLISNDGKQDKMLMATDFLNDRLKKIRAIRMNDPTVDDKMPTLADIERTHVLFMSAHFKPFAATAYEYNKVRPNGSATLGSSITFSIPQFGDFFNDMALHIKLGAPVLTQGTVTTPGVDEALLRWCDFPGHRLLKKVSFSVNGNNLDEYDSDVYNMWYQFRVPEDKRVGWKRCVGQEVESRGYVDQSPNVVENWRKCCCIANGAQTPKDAGQALELFVPLLFWFNVDPRLAIPSVSIPYGQRFINIDLAPANELLFTVTRGTSEATFSTPTVDEVELYINNIFVNPEIHDIFIKRIGFNLIRVHRTQNVNVTSSSDDRLLNNLKWPIETLYFGLRPSANRDLTDENTATNWWRFGSVTHNTYTGNESQNLSDGSATVSLPGCTVVECAPTVDRVSVTAHGVKLYDDFPSQFFNAYIPYTYGSGHIRTPDDCGLYMVTFNLYPGSYQPSGHINLSRAREFYLKYSSSVISPSNTGELVVVASAINFLLIADGGAVLRYTT